MRGAGIFGAIGDADAARVVAAGLGALRHRGEAVIGLVGRGESGLTAVRGRGTLDDAALVALSGASACIGEVSGSGSGRVGPRRAGVERGGVDRVGAEDMRPFLVRERGGQVAIAHDGQVTNSPVLRADIEARGGLLHSAGDTEAILHLVAQSEQKTFVNRLVDALARVEGAWCLLLLTADKMVAVRDPWGFRPLVLGRRRSGWLVATETCAIEAVEGEVVRDVEPGEMLILDGEAVESIRPFARRPRRACILEHVAAARSDSRVFGRDVYPARARAGEVLARDFPARGDVVIAVPESGVPAALGYARVSGLPFEAGLISGAGGITAVASIVARRRVVLVDDAIARGVTAQRLVRVLRAAGAVEVHVRIASPPLTGACTYGIETPETQELVAHRHDIGRVRAFLDADSLAYLSMPGLRESLLGSAHDEEAARFCDACFTGAYAVLPAYPKPSAQVPLFGS